MQSYISRRNFIFTYKKKNEMRKKKLYSASKSTQQYTELIYDLELPVYKRREPEGNEGPDQHDKMKYYIIRNYMFTSEREGRRLLQKKIY